MLLLAGLLWVGACVGHIAILSYSNNFWFGLALPHRFLTCMRLLHGLLVVLGVCTFAWALVLQTSPLAELESGYPWRVVAGVYGGLCIALGLVGVPILTFLRNRRARPACLLSNHTEIVDVPRQLGYRPLGRGKWRAMARLPGNQAFEVDFSERTLRLARLPAAWDGLRILHISDLHLCGTPDRPYFDYVMDRCRAWDPDLVALTGDVVDSDFHHRWILPVLARLRWGIAGFAILGNHDSWRDEKVIRRRLRRIGFRVLGNSWEQIEVRGEPMLVIGHEGPWFQPAPDLRECPRGPFRLCLSHTPDNIAWARLEAIDLVLAGHNHGGQIRFPWIGSVLVPSRYGRRYDCGTFDESPTVMHVSRGLGSQHPIRYRCRPEATLLILRSATAS